MATIGSLTAKINADTTGLESGLNKARQGMGKFGDDMKRMASSYTAAWVGMTAAVSGFVYASKKAVDAFLEQERAENQLANAMKTAGNYTRQAHKEMTQYATALQMSTTYSDEAVMSVMQLLQTYQLNISETRWATQATLDLATALGMDASSAARYMGMAMKGNTDMLARYVPALKKTVSEELKSMSVKEKVAFMMKQVNDQFGGRAQGELDTYGGKLQWLSGLMEDLQQAGVQGIINSLINQETAQDNAAESFKNLALIMTSGAEAITNALLWVVKAMASVGSGVDALWLGFLKLDEYAQRAIISVQKVFLAYAKWRGDADYQGRVQRELNEAQGKLVDILKQQDGAYSRLATSGTILGASGEEIGKSFDEMRTAIEGFGKQGRASIDDVQLSLKNMGESAEAAKKATEDFSFADAESMFNEMYSKQEDYLRTVGEVDNRIKELTSSTTDYQLYMLDKEIKALEAAGVDKIKLEQLYQLERQRIIDNGIEQQTKSIEISIKNNEMTWANSADAMRDSLKELFLNTAEGDFDDFFDRIANKLKAFLADIASSMIVNTASQALGMGKIIQGMGSLQDLGSLFKSTPTAPAGGVYDESAQMSYPDTGSQVGSAAGGAMGGIGALMGGAAGAWVGGVGIAVAVGMAVYDSIKSDREKREQMRKKRGEDFVNSLNEWMNDEYDSIENMFMGAGEDLFSGKGLYAARKYAGLGVSEWAYTWQKAMKVVRSESEQAGAVSVGSFRQVQQSLEKVAMTSPKAAKEVAELQQQLNDTFGKTLREDVADGLLTTNDAIQKLMRTGMDQLSAQTALFGEDYNELMLIMNGSITVIDGAAEQFNKMRENLDQLDEEIAALPDSLKAAKQQLENISYAIRYLINMTQSFVNVMDDMEKLPDIFEDLSNAIDAGDWSGAAKSMYELQNQTLEAASAFTQLGDALNYLGVKALANVASGIARIVTGFAALAVVVKFVFDVIYWFKELNKEVDLSLDKWDVWAKEIEDAEIAEIISDITDNMREWEDIISRATFGDIATDMTDMFDDLQYALLEIKRLAVDVEGFDYESATGKALQAYTEQIKAYFDAVLEGFEELSRTISRDIVALSPGGRTADMVASEIGTGFSDLAGIDVAKDPEKFLAKASEIRDLIMERYDMEKDRITDLYQAQIDYYEEMKAAYESLRDQVKGIINDIKTSGLNQGDIFERMTSAWDNIMALQTQFNTMAEGADKAAIGQQLASALQDYLGMAETAYTRPSLEYQGIYTTVMGMLEGLLTTAETQISVADAQIISLQQQMVAALKTLQEETIGQLTDIQGYIDDAEGTLAGIRDTALENVKIAIAEVGLAIGEQTRTLHLDFEDLKRKRWHFEDGGWKYYQNGTSYVPETGLAYLHKGEAVIPADQNTGGLTVPITLNYSGSANKNDVDAMLAVIQNDIKYGKTGMVLKEQIRRVM